VFWFSFGFVSLLGFWRFFRLRGCGGGGEMVRVGRWGGWAGCLQGVGGGLERGEGDWGGGSGGAGGRGVERVVDLFF